MLSARSVWICTFALAGALGCARAGTPPDGRAAAPGEGRLVLERCRLPGVSAQAKCGTLRVFENRAAASGRTIGIRVAVVPALAARPKPDPLFILAGGPGQAATAVAPMLVPAFDRVRRTRDLVFVDQRGTGASAPLDCALEPPDAGIAERIATGFRAETVRACATALSKDHDLRFYGTAIAMDDLDDVRAALGYERINLWGASYGTRAALIFARRHPEHVRSLVLDGVAPLQLVLPRDMAQDAQRAIDLLFDQCEHDAQCSKAWPGVRQKFAALLASLEDAPARATVPDPITGAPSPIVVTRDAFVRILRALLYQPEATTLVPLTIDRAAAGDFRPFAAQSDLVTAGLTKGLSNGMFFSVVCTEDVPFLDVENKTSWADGSFVGKGFADDVLSACEVWPRGEVPEGFRTQVKSDVPALLFSGELDPVTPPRWGELAAKALPHSAHIVVPGSGHGTLSDACVRSLIDQFLDAGSVQGLDLSCAERKRPPFFTSFAGPPP
ncbi:MAG: alpha/beta fold hydrolase [Myxococcaceae bacterium]|nr:alpha/beta fold hydrolase [Myxococcaceae bacterium]